MVIIERDVLTDDDGATVSDTKLCDFSYLSK